MTHSLRLSAVVISISSMANPWGKKQAAHSLGHGGDGGHGNPVVTKRVFFGNVSAETTGQEFHRMVIEKAGAIVPPSNKTRPGRAGALLFAKAVLLRVLVYG